MQPHQERVVEELKELNSKRERLGEFLETKAAGIVDAEELARLHRQQAIMKDYAEVLEERIRNFK